MMGRNAARVVAVEAVIGQNIRCTAALYAAFPSRPSFIFLSAYSTITIAPSISMPRPNKSPNMTMKLYVKPRKLITMKAKKKENGTANVTSKPDLTPTVAITTTSTRIIAVAILPVRPAFCSRAIGTELLI